MAANPARSGKAPVRVERFTELGFVPRFEYGHMAELAETCGAKDGAEFGSGFGRLKNAHIPWTIHYDEMLFVIEGELRLHTAGEIHELHVYDSIWLPAGTELVYEAEDALIVYAIHPNI